MEICSEEKSECPSPFKCFHADEKSNKILIQKLIDKIESNTNSLVLNYSISQTKNSFSTFIFGDFLMEPFKSNHMRLTQLSMPSSIQHNAAECGHTKWFVIFNVISTNVTAKERSIHKWKVSIYQLTIEIAIEAAINHFDEIFIQFSYYLWHFHDCVCRFFRSCAKTIESNLQAYIFFYVNDIEVTQRTIWRWFILLAY